MSINGSRLQLLRSDTDITGDEFKAEVTKMEAQKWNRNDQHVRPKTLVETLDHAIPQFYPVVYVVLVTLLTYPVSTCTAERSFCADDEAENSSLKYHE